MTSIPASRRARAITFAPRSCPSRPGFAMRTRIVFATFDTSVEKGLLPDAEHLAQDVTDLAEGRAGPNGVEDEGHRVLVSLACLPEAVQGAPVLLRVPRSPDATEPLERGPQGGLRDPEGLHLRLFVDEEVVHPDDGPLRVLDLPLIPVRGVRDLLLEEPLPDRGQDAAEVRDAIEGATRLGLELVREPFEVVRSAERVRRVRDAALMGEDLLGPQGDPDGLLARDLVGLVVGVRVKGLHPAEDGSEPLDRRPDDVHLRLLCGEGHARGLRVEPEEPGTRVLRAEGVPHLPRPDPPRGAVLRDLLEEVVVRVEEEGQARREIVDEE